MGFILSRYRGVWVVKPLNRGLTSTTLVLVAYLIIVVATTPNLPPHVAIAVTLRINALFLTLLTISFFVNGYLIGMAMQNNRCKINRKTAKTASAGGAVLSSMVSFLPLTSVGCCSLWLYILSLVAGTGTLGATFIGTLLNSPSVFMIAGLSTIWITNIIMYIKLKNTARQYATPYA